MNLPTVTLTEVVAALVRIKRLVHPQESFPEVTSFGVCAVSKNRTHAKNNQRETNGNQLG